MECCLKFSRRRRLYLDKPIKQKANCRAQMPSAMLIAVIAIIALVSGFSVRADYPIVSHHYAADPAAVEFNGRLYVYCSNDDDNGTNSYIMSSLTCFSTDDLKNWTDHGVVFRATNTSWASLAWAPSAVSNQSKVFLYFANSRQPLRWGRAKD